MKPVPILSFLAVLLPSAAMAHVGGHASGQPFTEGLMHPIGGLDHLLAMVAVGLWAALAGGRALWAYPAAFVLAMLAGGALGMAGIAFPAVEPLILASIVALGAATALAFRAPMPVALAVIAVFGAAHGHAHGAEGPSGGMLPYAAGFAAATAVLHILGLGFGWMAREAGRPALTRLAGALAAVAGFALAAG